MKTVSEKDARGIDNEVLDLLWTAVQADFRPIEKASFATMAAMGISEIEVPFLISIALKRVDALSLPISFSLGGLLAFGVFPDRAGASIAMLIDLLGEYRNKTVTLQDIMKVYPFGFYNEEALIRRIDEIKADAGKEASERKEEFSYVYLDL